MKFVFETFGICDPARKIDIILKTVLYRCIISVIPICQCTRHRKFTNLTTVFFMTCITIAFYNLYTFL